MRILHFSDFHLNGGMIQDAKHTLKYMFIAIEQIQEETPIDLVIFSGDILERGGEGYNHDLKVGFNKFKEEIIAPIMDEIGQPLSRFIFTPGNHDIDRSADSPRLEDNLEKEASTLKGIIQLTKAKDVDDYTKRIQEFKSFEKEYYESLEDITYNWGKFVSTFELVIDGVRVGISSLNTVWRCGHDDAHKIALGINQITECNEHLNDKDLRIAVTHYPIGFLKDIEREEVCRLCSKHFDILFCGHSHGGYVNFQAPFRNKGFFEINTSGTLASNTYENDRKYQNAFQIIDIDLAGKYVIQTFKQVHYQEFELDREEFPNGRNERIYPSEEHLVTLFEEHQKRLNEAKDARIREMIHPFELIDEFVSRPNNEVMKSRFETSERIDAIRTNIRNSPNDCRLMALSGMGKTRVIAETFKGQESVYYSRDGKCIEGLNALLKYCNPKVIIIDNCSQESMREAYKCIDEFGARVRLITIYNVLKPEEQSTRGDLYTFDYTMTEEIVDKMIAAEEVISTNPHLAQAIKTRSGNIPYMTILLILAYKKNNTLKIDNPSETLSSILRGNEPLDENKEKVLLSLSLFDPLGFEGTIEDEFDFVLHNCKIHHIPLEQELINVLFKDTISEYLNRQLIEKEGYCLRVRPKPLAEWLTESWLIRFGESMADVFDDINSLDSNVAERLFRALNNRVKEMQTSPSAKQVFDTINNPVNGSFHNERIAFSKSGSQLFLSMGLVSPAMVANNLWSLIDSKSIEWLRDDMNPDARRNLVWALENICTDAGAFMDGAKCLAKLSVAENEDISNNATGQFLQLFHIFLSGTQADLKMRISLIQSLRGNDIYLPLLIQAIGSAFVSRGFYRTNTSGIPQFEETLVDYHPVIGEIKRYWHDCADLLMYITEQDPDLLPMIIELLPKHVSDFAQMQELPLLIKLIEYYGKYVDYEWPEMRDYLSMCLQHWFKGSEELRGELIKWLKIMTPKTLLGRIKASLKDEQYHIDGDFETYRQKIMSQMLPFAEEFINHKLYYTQEFEDIMLDDQLRASWFVICVAQITNDRGLAKEILASTLKVVLRRPESFECDFIPSLICQITDTEAIEDFKKELIAHKRFNLYSSIVGSLDGEGHTLLQELIDGYKSSVFDNNCINNYLRYYKYYTIHNILDIFDLLYNAEISSKEVCYPFIMNHLRYSINKNDECILKRYKRILLEYDFDDSYLSSQIVDAIIEILKSGNDHEFAKAVHDKTVKYLCSPESSSHSFEQLYFALLPQYQDDILDDLCEILALEDEGMIFYYRMYNYLGSGFSFGAGPLFQCDWEKLKDACIRHQSVLPQRFAHMCPVYKYSDNGVILGFSDFFLWLCDNFGDQKQMLHSFSSNMGTYSWSGINGFSDFIAGSIPFLKRLLEHEKPNVREWAALELERNQKEVTYETNKEAYERMIRG